MSKIWKIGILKDTSKPNLGGHGLHVAFRGLPNVEVVAHVDSNSKNIGEEMAWTQAERHYTSYIEMLDAEKPDIVVITSRNPSDHIAPVLEAAKRGIHIYCEKPLTLDLKEAEAIITTLESSGIKLCMAHPARYAPAFCKMKEMVESGEIGTPLTIHGRGKCDHRGGAEDLIVLGTHILDYMEYIFGKPQSIWAEVLQDGVPVNSQTRRETVESLGNIAGDDIYSVIRFENGVRGIFESRKDLFVRESKNIFMGITISGTDGAISYRFNDSYEPNYKLRISRHSAPVEDKAEYVEVPAETVNIPNADELDYSLCGKPDIPIEPFFLEANRAAAWDLICSIEKGLLPRSNVYNAHETIKMIQRIFESGMDLK